MDIDALREYERKEKEKVIGSLPAGISNGILKDIKAYYPDVGLAEFHALARKGAPLNLLCFLYPQVTIFVPPESRQKLELRFGLEFESLLELCAKQIVIPLIGHPIDYANSPHLDPLLNMNPPAIWPRGLTLLEVLGTESLFQEAEKQLPLDQMTSLPQLKQKWRTYHSSLSASGLRAKIKEELMTNYIDLIIFGYREIAEKIVAISDPAAIAVLLLLANETLTYPLLFGIGGTPNYPDQRYRQFTDQSLFGRVQKKPFIVPEYLDILLEGLKINISGKIDADTVIEFHKEGLSHKLWKSLSAFEKAVPKVKDPNEVLNAADELQSLVKETISGVQDSLFSKAREKTRRRMSWLFKAGGASIGFAAASQFVPLQIAAAVAGGLPLVLKHLAHINTLEEWVTDHAMAKQYSPATAHLWHLKRWADERRK
jgi:hypothetical protein